jgi:hypothetical protein
VGIAETTVVGDIWSDGVAPQGAAVRMLYEIAMGNGPAAGAAFDVLRMLYAAGIGAAPAPGSALQALRYVWANAIDGTAAVGSLADNIACLKGYAIANAAVGSIGDRIRYLLDASAVGAGVQGSLANAIQYLVDKNAVAAGPVAGSIADRVRLLNDAAIVAPIAGSIAWRLMALREHDANDGGLVDGSIGMEVSKIDRIPPTTYNRFSIAGRLANDLGYNNDAANPASGATANAKLNWLTANLPPGPRQPIGGTTPGRLLINSFAVGNAYSDVFNVTNPGYLSFVKIANGTSQGLLVRLTIDGTDTFYFVTNSANRWLTGLPPFSVETNTDTESSVAANCNIYWHTSCRLSIRTSGTPVNVTVDVSAQTT